MDVSAVSLVVPEPSLPSKADNPAAGAKQFEQLLAAGVGGSQAAAPQGQPPVGRAAPTRPERRDAPAAPVKDKPDLADKADRDRVRTDRAKTTDDDQDSDSDRVAAEYTGSSDGDAVVILSTAAGLATVDAATPADGGADQTAADAATADGTAAPTDAVTTAPAAGPTSDHASALAASAAGNAPVASATPGAQAAAPAPVTPSPAGPGAPAPAPTLPTDPAAAAADSGQSPASASSNQAATPAPGSATASDLASAAAKLAAALAAGSEAAAKPASADSSAASMANAGKTTASEALAQLNQQSADAVVRIGNGAAGQDAGQQGLGGSLARGNGAAIALDRAPLTTTSPTVATDTLLFSQLEQAAQLDTSVEGPAPLPVTGPLGETGSFASSAASATATTTAGAATATAPAAAPPARPVTPMLLPLIDQVLPHFSQAGSTDGTGRFTINLRPPELGKVQVNLKVGADGHVAAAIVADRQDTLSLLQRDAHLLEQALADAGLSTSNGDLQFSLSGDSQGTGFEDGPGSYNAGVAASTPIDEPEAPAAPRQIAGLSLVDLHV